MTCTSEDLYTITKRERTECGVRTSEVIISEYWSESKYFIFRRVFNYNDQYSTQYFYSTDGLCFTQMDPKDLFYDTAVNLIEEIHLLNKHESKYKDQFEHGDGWQTMVTSNIELPTITHSVGYRYEYKKRSPIFAI